MRGSYHPCQLTHLLSVLLAVAAIVLTFLILFAGSKPNFMEDYAIITLNTSRIGQNLFNSSSSSSSSNPLTNLIHGAESALEHDAESDISSLAADIGLADFYSAHMLDHCQGTFTPGPVPNATLPLNKIKHNVTSCSKRTAFSHFDPEAELQATLDKTGTGVTLQELGFPRKLEDGVTALEDVFDAVFVLYCVGVGFAFFALLSSAFFASPAASALSRLASALCHLLVTGLAALCLLIASVAVTVVAVRGAKVINRYGNAIGISGDWGGKFLALTWAASGCLMVATVLGLVPHCFTGSGRRRGDGVYYDK